MPLNALILFWLVCHLKTKTHTPAYMHTHTHAFTHACTLTHTHTHTPTHTQRHTPPNRCETTFQKSCFYFALTPGSGFDHGHLCRAVCCRLYNNIYDELPTPFTLVHPELHPTTFSVRQYYPQEGQMTTKGLNWSLACPNLVEITNSVTGKLTKE